MLAVRICPTALSEGTPHFVHRTQPCKPSLWRLFEGYISPSIITEIKSSIHSLLSRSLSDFLLTRYQHAPLSIAFRFPSNTLSWDFLRADNVLEIKREEYKDSRPFERSVTRGGACSRHLFGETVYVCNEQVSIQKEGVRTDERVRAALWASNNCLVNFLHSPLHKATSLSCMLCIILIIFHVVLMIFEVDNISPKTLWEKYEESVVYDMLLKLL